MHVMCSEWQYYNPVSEECMQPGPLKNSTCTSRLLHAQLHPSSHLVVHKLNHSRHHYNPYLDVLCSAQRHPTGMCKTLRGVKQIIMESGMVPLLSGNEQQGQH